MNLYTFASQIPMLKKYLIGARSKGHTLMIISVVVGLFLSLTELYYFMYIINPNWFVISERVACSSYKTAFEFIYYTFSVTITYSGSGIEAAGILPKILQMFHVLFFYLFAGDTILQLLKKE